MSPRVKIAGLAVVVVGLLALGTFLSLLRYGFSTHDEPTRMEAVVARSFRHWSVPADLRDLRNPVPLTSQVLAEARAHWADHCATCHGNDGKGRTPIGEHLYPRAPDMTRRETQGLSDGELFSVIENGIRLTGMPGWGEGNAASGYASWALVHLIRRLPQITPQELEEIEKLEPKTPEEWEQQREEEEFLQGEDTGAAAAHGPHEHHH